MNSDRRSMRLVTRIGIAVMVALALMVPLAASAHTNVSNGKLKNFQHVFVIMMENTSFTSLIGNKNAPWINFAREPMGSRPTILELPTPVSLITSRQPPARPMASPMIMM